MMAQKTTREIIGEFLEEGPYAVVGASRNRSKYGNKVLRAYLQTGRDAYPVNPNAERVEGLSAYASLRELPEVPRAISIITPPEVTEQIVEEAAEVGVEFIWMQPGAESEAAIRSAMEHGINLIADGSCALVAMGYRE